MAKILVVDDEKELRDALAKSLEACGYNVTVAEDGKDALEKFRLDDELKLVISDLHMPIMDGLELAVYIRDSNREIPVMLVTTETNPELIYQGNLAKIERWLVKPLNIDALTQGIQLVMKKISKKNNKK